MQHLLLLHGAIGSKTQFAGLAESLEKHYIVHTLNFSGHGGRELPDSFSIEGFADDVLEYLSQEKLDSVSIFGYSMGGYVALYLARHYPEKVASVFTLATKFLWTPEIALRETKMLDAEKIAQKIPAFAKQLEERHNPADWKAVLVKTAGMMISLGNKNPLIIDDFKQIRQPVQIGIGDRDLMVTLEETVSAYKDLPNANLIVLPKTSHPIEKADTKRLSLEILAFFR